MAQTAGTDGTNNIVVQIEGDGNTINLKGLPHLTLTRYLTRRHVDNDADILSPYSFSIPMVGRGDELAGLGRWLDGQKPISVRVLTGRAGAGKTRLALELIEARLEDGWDAGITTSRELSRFFNQQNLQSWGWQRPTLIVIDYAASHAGAIYDWLAELADHGGIEGKQLRLLLLERNANQEAGWWRTAFGYADGTAKAIQRLLDPAEPIALPPIDEHETKWAIFQAALAEGKGDLQAPAPGEDVYFDQRLQDLTWGGEPLFLMMAGLLGAKHGVSQVLALSRTDLAFDLAEQELERIGRAGKGNRSRTALLRHMAAYATLCGGLTRMQLEQAIDEERSAIRREDAGDTATLADLLIDFLPDAAGDVAPILPDMIGEAACLLALDSKKVDDVATLLRALDQERLQVAAIAIRTAQDFAGQMTSDEKIITPLVWVDAIIEDCRDNVDHFMILANQFPERTTSLASHALKLHAQIGVILRGRVDDGDITLLPNLAMSLDSQANRLSDMGHPEAALEVAEEAVTIYRGIEEGIPDLARALNNLSNKRWALNRSDALDAINESVHLCEDLVSRPDGSAHVPGLARSLYNQGNILDCQGNHDLAKSSLFRALNIYRELAERFPESFRPNIALTLDLLGIVLTNLGDDKDALLKTEEAVGINEEIAAARPDEFLPNLARSLINFALRLSLLKLHDRAIDNAMRAVSLYNELAEEMPGAFAHDLANSWVVLGECTWNSGERTRALRFFEEAVQAVVLSLENAGLSYEKLLRSIVEKYVSYSRELDRELDQTLLDRVQQSVVKAISDQIDNI